MAGYAARSIANALLRQSDIPVVILEGARAVGKTTMMRRQVASANQFSYSTFADPTTLEFATHDLSAWLRQLSLPAIIDEAQLIPELPLALKELVDTLGPGNHFILTGSASIGRSGLGGADPLTRRSHRLTMSPLTSWEISNQPGSLVDALFDGTPVAGKHDAPTDEQLLDEMLTGGFPSYVFPSATLTRSRVMERVRSDVAAVLSDAILPGTGFDATIAQSALDGLLRTPGGIFNASRLAQRLDLDRRTIDRYLGIFERLFLVHWLPNLATSVSRQSHARSKIHAVDTSFAVESLRRGGTAILDEREKFGELLETHVVNQVTAAMQWATVTTSNYFWRQASNTSPEVDLVLVDASDRAVGIEVKASRRIGLSDLTGLRAFQKTRELHRGFIFYTGDEVRQLDESIWALPIAALRDGTIFNGTWSDRPSTESDSYMAPQAHVPRETFDASMFLSYVHADNERSGGRIVQFAKDLVSTYDYLYGHKIELFIDRDDIRWGENWATRLSQTIEVTSFMLSVVTPRYLTSEACRTEVLSFGAAAKEAAVPGLLLPLQWIDTSDTDVVAPNDPVRLQLEHSQYVDATKIRRTAVGSLEYEAILETIAGRLKATIEGRRKTALAGTNDDSSRPDDTDDRDLITVMTDLEERQAKLETATLGFKKSFELLGAEFENRPPMRLSSTYATSAALAQLGKELEGPVRDIEVATAELGNVWQEYDSGLARAILLVSDMPELGLRMSLAETLDSMPRTFELPGSEALEQQLKAMSNLSRHLQPLSNAVSSALRLLQGIQQSARAWRDRL